MTDAVSTKSNFPEADRMYALQHDVENLQQLKDSSAKDRIAKLRKLEKYLVSEPHLTECTDALWKDLHKSREETIATELATVLTTIKHTTSNLESWMGDQPVGKPLAMMGLRSFVRIEPKGHALIMSPWNYPIQLLLNPLIHAIAAGNAVLVKPSEMAPATSAFLKKMFGEIFAEQEVAIIEGGVDVATALLKKRFDHIFFTGSPRVGKIVMKAAAEHLTSVTLELGGKSPVVVDRKVEMRTAAEKIVWGKITNAGQTCIAPDYAIVPENLVDEFVVEFQLALQRFYGAGDGAISKSPDYVRMIHSDNLSRMEALLSDAVTKGAEVVLKGVIDKENLLVSPFLITRVTSEMRVMQEEIFGPIMPIITYKEWTDVPAIIDQHERPLALYVMSKNTKRINYLMQHTISGGVGINETLVTIINPHLPFGGVNHSGMGKSNGKHGFLAFSNERGVVKRTWLNFKMLYPPYNKTIFRWLLRLSRF